MKVLGSKIRLDVPAAESAYRELLPKVDRKPYVNLEAVEAMLQILGERDPKIAELRPEQIVDVSILRRLDQEGFIR